MICVVEIPMERDCDETDILIIGGGPAGMAAAIRAKQLANDAGKEVKVCVVEKASEVGGHILSGAVMDPVAVNELIPDWKDKESPFKTPVTEDQFKFLTTTGSFPIPIIPGKHLITIKTMLYVNFDINLDFRMAK